MKSLNSSKAFTLIELLIVIGILAVLATTVLLVINPAQLVRQSRDANRITELNQINKALLLFQSFGGSSTAMGTHGTVYVSIPSDQTDCSDLSLPALGGGYVYACKPSTTYRNIDGTGWIPVDLTSIQGQAGTLFSNLPIDPTNTVTDNLYYTYIPGSWALSATMESEKYLNSNATSDGGQATTRFELGNDLSLNESLAWSCGVDSLIDLRDGKTYSTVLIGTQCWMAQNLNVGTKTNSCIEGPIGDGSPCSNFGYTVNDQGTSCSSIQKYCYRDTESYCTQYGALYQWNQAMCGSTIAGDQGICPTGWHIPSHDEWTDLERQVCVDAGISSSTCNTNFPKDSTTVAPTGCGLAGVVPSLRESGSSGLNLGLFGYRTGVGGFHWLPGQTFYWTSNISGTNGGWSRNLNSWELQCIRRFDNSTNTYASYGTAIRCIHD